MAATHIPAWPRSVRQGARRMPPELIRARLDQTAALVSVLAYECLGASARIRTADPTASRESSRAATSCSGAHAGFVGIDGAPVPGSRCAGAGGDRRRRDPERAPRAPRLIRRSPWRASGCDLMSEGCGVLGPVAEKGGNKAAVGAVVAGGKASGGCAGPSDPPSQSFAFVGDVVKQRWASARREGKLRIRRQRVAV